MRHKHHGIEYDDISHPKYKYRLARDYTFKLSVPCADYEGLYLSVRNNVVRAFIEYCYDGPSGPTVDSENSMRAALEHDIAYQLFRVGAIVYSFSNRRNVDKKFYKVLREDGMNWFRAQYWYWGVRVGGYPSTQ